MIFACGCSALSGKSMPHATAVVENSEITIPVEITSASWGAKEIYGGPWETMNGKEPVVVPKSSRIKISFEYPPKEIHLRETLSKKEFKNMDIESNTIVVPDSKGIHIYSFNARWSEGSVAYAIKIEVK